MFRTSLCPSSGEQGCVLLHMVFCTGCAGRGSVVPGRELCALCESSSPYVHDARSQGPKIYHTDCRVQREKPTRCNQSDVYYQTSISTCFGHHYAHHQENKAVYYRIWCSAVVVLAVVVWSWVASCVKVTVTFTQCTQVTTQLHTTTASTTSAEHHMQ